jgi:hypothetical protein
MQEVYYIEAANAVDLYSGRQHLQGSAASWQSADRLADLPWLETNSGASAVGKKVIV